MSRGLGRLQREILDTLDEAKANVTRYHGSSWRGPGWVHARGIDVPLPDHVYDLRASVRYLAGRHGAVYGAGRDGYGLTGYVDTAFAAGFSRAAAGLVVRGDLVACDAFGQPTVSDPWRRRQRRFVRRADRSGRK